MSAAIFNGTAIKLLKKILKFKDSNITVITGDGQDPTSVAKDAVKGSLYIRDATSEVYIKKDNGSSTNWVRIGTTDDLANYILLTEKGASNGVATLDAGGKVPASQLPNTVMEFQGTWNASTNTPTLADGVGNVGDVWVTTTAGTQNLGSGSITFAIGDWVIYNASNIWQKSINSNAVVSVNGYQGVVNLNANDVLAADQTLSNLSGSTAISQHMLVASDGGASLGSGAKKWLSLYAYYIHDAAGQIIFDLLNRRAYDNTNIVAIDHQNRYLSNTSGPKLYWNNSNLEPATNIVPDTNAAYDLGSSSKRFNNIFAGVVTATAASPSVVLGASASLQDSSSTVSVDWPNRRLKSGATTKLDWSGTDLDINTRKITNVVDPSSNQDAATKKYVDDKLGAYPTIQKFTSGSGTYTTPANVRYIKVRMVGGGAGGSGTGSGAGSPSDGGNTTFGSSLLTANGGTYNTGPQGGAGGSATINSPAYGTTFVGGNGQGYTLFQKLTGNDLSLVAGGMGGGTPFGGAGAGGGQGSDGVAAAANSGSGGGGACGETSQTNNANGTGGGAGGYVEAYITSPSATYSYAVGAGGSGGTAGTGGNNGGAGAAGIIIVEEFY